MYIERCFQLRENTERTTLDSRSARKILKEFLIILLDTVPSKNFSLLFTLLSLIRSLMFTKFNKLYFKKEEVCVTTCNFIFYFLHVLKTALL